MFKLQHPADLISKLFILEYMREIGPNALYMKANKEQKKTLFYKFLGEEDEQEQIDINWEACIFNTSIPELSILLEKFLPEIEKIDSERNLLIKKQVEIKQKELEKAPTDINLRDFANALIENSKGKIIT